MNEVKVVRDTYAIAGEINIIKEQTNQILLNSSIEIGKRLVEAKELVGHGNWQKWLQEEVNYSVRTAQNLMKIYDEYGVKMIEKTNAQTFAHLGFSQAIAMLQLDFEERESFMEEHDPDQMTVKEFEEAIKEKKALEEEKTDLENQLAELKDKDSQYAEVLKEKIRVITEYEEMIKEKNQDIRDLKALVDEKDNSEEVDPEVVEKLQKDIQAKEDELKTKKAEIRELKKKLKEKPAEVEVEKIVEKIPDDIQQKLDALSKDLESAHQKMNSSESMSRFKSTFRLIVQMFNDLIDALDGIRDDSEEDFIKYRDAVNKFLDELKIE